MRYNRDPYWLTAKYAGKCAACGKPIRQGEKCFYYPATKSIYSGECATNAANDFSCMSEAEAFYNA